MTARAGMVDMIARLRGFTNAGTADYTVNSRSLYGCLVTRGAPVYATGGLTVRLTILQD